MPEKLKDTPHNWLLLVLFLVKNCAKIHGDTFHDSSEGFLWQFNYDLGKVRLLLGGGGAGGGRGFGGKGHQ